VVHASGLDDLRISILWIVYNRPIHNEKDLRNRLQEAFGTITPEMVRASKLNLLRRAQLCLEMNGGHFEHLL
jgi:hypothetical protein